MAKKPQPTVHQAIIAAYQTLKDESLLPPRTPEEIAALEEEFGRYPAGQMSPDAALKYAKGLIPLPAITPPAPFPELKGTIEQEFGIAARGGSDIPDAVWTKMKEDRSKARDARRKQRG